MSTKFIPLKPLPESFQKEGNIFRIYRKKRYPRSKFTISEFNDEGHFSSLNTYEIRKPKFKEIKETNPRELVEGFFFMTILIIGIIVPSVLIYQATGLLYSIPFGAFIGLFVGIIIIAILSEFTKESKYIIISRDQSVFLLEKGEKSFRYYVVDREKNELYFIHLKGGLGGITLDTILNPEDISNYIRVKKSDQSLVQAQSILSRQLTYDTLKLIINGVECCELAYGDLDNHIYAKIPNKYNDPAKMAIVIALINPVWTIPEPDGGGGG